MMTKRILVDDERKKAQKERQKTLQEKLKGKAVADLKASELAELVLLVAQSTGWVDEEGKVMG
jgi:hypothetical protein